jgi:TPR repeat protein
MYIYYQVQYEQAIRWFERAAALDDPRVSEKARLAAIELKALVERAYKENQDVIDRIRDRAMDTG